MRNNDPCLYEYLNNSQLAGNREYHEYQGKAAKKAILSRLANWPKARILAAKICDFYGDCLQYQEDNALESSHYQIKLKHDPIVMQHARIELQLGTSRTAEALCHELLHLNTRISGYPFGEKFFIPYGLAQYATVIIGIYPKIGNLLEHELILEKFLYLGFDKSNFLGCISPPPDYRKLASAALNSPFYRKEIGFSWWCLEYLRHWISTRHWTGDEPAVYADYALFWGSKVHPALMATAQNIRELIESGALTNHKQYHLHVNTLLELMKAPKLTEWALIQTGNDNKPLAIRLVQEGEVKPDIAPAQHTANVYRNSILL